MQPAKSTNSEKAEPANNSSERASLKKTGRQPKVKKLVCRYCGSDDVAPSFVRRRDRRCRACFSKRYGSAAREKRAKIKK